MMMSLSVNQIACNKEILLEVVCECFDTNCLLSLKRQKLRATKKKHLSSELKSEVNAADCHSFTEVKILASEM